ncbi:MAG: argininosuccinate synthase [Firmicutes bacterium]|nr:argininosuccinate synthase [Bacillota bacterium]MBQ3112332.1 argininosuccinate synthase [Bacillota bacterium]MBQ6841984.1 argininosuccinate synthase [Bacillota bacterium]MBR6824706.1 argininosuccinate synthase [Bacillota bacterium]MBR7113359.1 argininosuccinate synthase [Bacillota bacterium]
MTRKIALAYSGGLDTSVIIPWLKENYDCEVIAVCGDVGQEADYEPVKAKALASGAAKCYVGHLTEEYVADYIFPCLKAGAVYEGKYLLGTSHARPIIAKYLVDVAKAEGCDAICHGCTGKGNDQVRFELTIKALAPEMEIIAPWRIWDISSREEELAYAEAHGIPVGLSKDKLYSMDENVWHLSHEGADLENPANEPQDDLLLICKTLQNAPDAPEYVEIGFEQGIPVSVNGEKLAPLPLLEKLNAIGAEHGVGVIDIVENRLVGIKSRGVYETPGGTILFEAHNILESITLDKATSHYKAIIAHEYADLVYNGMWFCPLKEALDAFVDSTQKTVTGTVRLKLYKGNIVPAGVTSPYTLYSESLASFTTGELFSHKDAEGFINLFGLPLKVRAMLSKEWPQE